MALLDRRKVDEYLHTASVVVNRDAPSRAEGRIRESLQDELARAVAGTFYVLPPRGDDDPRLEYRLSSYVIPSDKLEELIDDAVDKKLEFLRRHADQLWFHNGL